MTNEPKKSRRGYYYDLTESPYEYLSPYGDLFKFPSAKQLDVYCRNVEKEVEKIDKVFDRVGCKPFLHGNTMQAVYRSVYRSFYSRMGY